MSERDFQNEVLTRLGELVAHQAETTAHVEAVVQRLDKLNGKVAAHEESINALKLLEARRAGDMAVTSGLLKFVQPAFWLAVGIGAMWVLQNGQHLLALVR